MSGYATGVRNAARRGKEAARQSRSRDDCPYQRRDYQLAWNQGYTEGRRDVEEAALGMRPITVDR